MMGITSSLQPDTQSLFSGLRSVLGVSNPGELVILHREENHYASGSFSEIVDCKLTDGRELRLLFKYAQHSEGMRQAPHAPFRMGSWTNVPYEAEVYQHVLEPLHLSTAKFYGTHTELDNGRLWLVLEYFDDAVPLNELPQSPFMRLAASWLGRFHAASERWHASTSVSFLNKRDPAFYLEHGRKALLYASPIGRSTAWLPELCRNAETFITNIWARRPPVVIHGDYYPHNILFHEGEVHPVDWEHASVDLAEIDLACLTHGWEASVSRSCEIAYQKARWLHGSPSDFSLVLDAARLCLHFYEAGILPDWTKRQEGIWLRRKLRVLGKRLGLI